MQYKKKKNKKEREKDADIVCLEVNAVIHYFVTGKFKVSPLLVMFVGSILNARCIKEKCQAFLDSAEWLSNLSENF